MGETGQQYDKAERHEHICWLIYWDENAQDAYAYGSKVTFEWDGTVVFENEGMPPGFVIREWRSYTDYGGQQVAPQLPILEEGKSYYLRVMKRDEPEQGSFVRVNYYDRKGELLGFELLKENENRMTYPKGAYQYTLQLVQGGAKIVRFRRIELVPEENWESWKTGHVAGRQDGRTRTCRW